MSTFFMIHHKPTGLYSKGGRLQYGNAVLTQDQLKSLTDRGRVWNTIGSLRNHLNHAKYNDDFEVIECVIQIVNNTTISAQREITESNRKKREDARERRLAPYRLAESERKLKKAEEDAKLAALKQKYPDLAN